MSRGHGNVEPTTVRSAPPPHATPATSPTSFAQRPTGRWEVGDAPTPTPTPTPPTSTELPTLIADVPDPATWREVAVIRALRGLGDMLCLVPALRRLRAGAPQARLTCIGVPAGRWLLERYPELIDDWVDLPSWPTIPEADGDPDDTVRMLAARAGTFDAVVQLQGSGGQINHLAEVLSRDVVAVHVQPGERVLPSGGHRWYLRPWPTVGHEAERLASLVSEIGCPVLPVHLEFPVRADDVQQLPSALAQPGARPVAVVHPGASRADRRWSADGFTAVARHLHALGMQVVVTGTSPELGVVGAVVDGCTVTPWVVVDAPLGGTAALLRAASVLVSNDTGVAHLGVAVGVPTVVVGTTSDLDRWAPMDRGRHDAVRTTGHTPTDVRLVLARLDALLQRHRPAPARLAG